MAKILQFGRNTLQGVVKGRSSASDTRTQILGMKELFDRMAGLPDELQKKAVYAALGSAARIVRAKAVELVPEIDDGHPSVKAGTRRKGTVKRAIRASRSKINKGQRGYYEMIIRVKPLKGKAKKDFKKASGLPGAKNPDDPYYWWWVEFGTSRSAAKPFLRPAFNTTKDAQLAALRKRIAAFLDKWAKQTASEVNRAA